MFGNFKKKLSSAIQGGIIIGESLQQHVRQRVSSPTTPTSPTTLLGESLNNSSHHSSLPNISTADLELPSDINIAAGCNLLAKYENDWKVIHENNEINAKKAANAAAQIDSIENHFSKQRTVMNELINCLSGLPAIIQEIKTSTETLNEIMQLSKIAEEKLENLEDLCEECDLQELMLQKQFELSQHKQKKLMELENYRQKIAIEQHQKMRQQEDRLRQIQRERQAVFDDAFRCDIEEYKQTGHIQKIQKDVAKETPLEEVVLEDTDTKDALEEFLNG